MLHYLAEIRVEFRIFYISGVSKLPEIRTREIRLEVSKMGAEKKIFTYILNSLTNTPPLMTTTGDSRSSILVRMFQEPQTRQNVSVEYLSDVLRIFHQILKFSQLLLFPSKFHSIFCFSSWFSNLSLLSFKFFSYIPRIIFEFFSKLLAYFLKFIFENFG